MSMRSTSADKWLEVIRDEYLSSFVMSGGSAIKFAVASNERRPELIKQCAALGKQLNYLCIQQDSAQVKAHMAHEIFFDIARELDWWSLARRVVLRLARDEGFLVESVRPDPTDDVFEQIAHENAVDGPTVRRLLRPSIATNVSNNLDFLRAFRLAMDAMCLAGSKKEAHPLPRWLRGERVSIVRDFYIYTRIDRTTAKYFIDSTFHWIKLAGYSGALFLLDNARTTLAPNPRDGKLYYTKGMRLDHFNLLREFIDDIDNLESTLIIVAAGEEFQDTSSARGRRGIGTYDALRHRLESNVGKDEDANPVCSLVQLQ